MLARLAASVPYMVEHAADRIAPGAVPGVTVPARALKQMLGVIYGDEPFTWVAALREVRPDLVPPRADQMPAAS
ncbi:hypothetical protein ACGFJT_37455 [Actinomadura geliboluensis]|uniref:hypothetical protein n=1 Tax=Actinomadura geliboluensis TaxID=882440 RepID=UPI00371D0A51